MSCVILSVLSKKRVVSPNNSFFLDGWNPIKTWSDLGLFSAVNQHPYEDYGLWTSFPMGSFFPWRKALRILPWDPRCRRYRSSTMWAEWSHFGCAGMAWGNTQVQSREFRLVVPYCLIILSSFSLFWLQPNCTPYLCVNRSEALLKRWV